MLSNGDANAFKKVLELDPYDELIKKEECVNHVGKRLGTALHNLVSDCSKKRKSDWEVKAMVDQLIQQLTPL